MTIGKGWCSVGAPISARRGVKAVDFSASASVLAGELLRAMDPKNLVQGLEEEVRWKFRACLFVVAAAGFGRARVIETKRSLARQMMLYGKGRTSSELRADGVDPKYAAPGCRRVSWILPRLGMHVRGLAWDVDFSMYDARSLARLEGVVESIGVTWGGAWKVRDYGHFEARD